MLCGLNNFFFILDNNCSDFSQFDVLVIGVTNVTVLAVVLRGEGIDRSKDFIIINQLLDGL